MKDTLTLHSLNIDHLKIIAQIIKDGGVVAFPFNGIFGLFGNIDNPQVSEQIMQLKQRPSDKNLIIVIPPEDLSEVVDLSKIYINYDKLVSFWKKIHALGVILPASTTAPIHLIKNKDNINTVLVIWTEYQPLKDLMAYLKELGIRGLVGTSANKLGQPAHHRFDELSKDFNGSIDAVVEGSFDHLPKERKRSTTVIDLTNERVSLHRLGNVSGQELNELLKIHEMPGLESPGEVIYVSTRN